ncbi:MAG: hypothetical protein K2L99_08215 [Muribaculaceae bacterium]|nr:hypothetical protein [Muribaculaceae bacterium]MDE6286962.1 hypothetical protein [Muribaculaceae bacterium]
MSENNLDDIRREWQSLSADTKKLAEANRILVERLAAEKATSKQQNLRRQYLIFAVVSFLLLPALAYVGLYDLLEAPLWLCVLYAAGGVFFGITDLCFVRMIGSVDYIELPTCEAVAHASRMILWQARLRAIGIAAAVVIVAPLFVFMYRMGKPDVLIGGIAGLVIGAVLGTLKYNSLRRTARRMLADLES